MAWLPPSVLWLLPPLGGLFNRCTLADNLASHLPQLIHATILRIMLSYLFSSIYILTLLHTHTPVEAVICVGDPCRKKPKIMYASVWESYAAAGVCMLPSAACGNFIGAPHFRAHEHVTFCRLACYLLQLCQRASVYRISELTTVSYYHRDGSALAVNA